MRIAIVGAGAIGGWIAARLLQAGHDVAILARGDTLDRIRENGLTLEADGKVQICHPRVSGNAEEIGPCDAVFVAVKAPALAAISQSIPGLLGDASIVVPMLNGVPWWFMGPGQGLTSVDPAGEIARAIPFDRVVACVVHAASLRKSPAHVQLLRSDRLLFGEPEGGSSERVTQLVEMLRAASLPAEISTDIRSDIWFKLWGNMTINPISALTLATSDRILDDPLVVGLIETIMEEARRIGSGIASPILESASDRNEVTRKLGAFRTSMLQDVEAGRQIELDALLGAPREIAQRLGIETPGIDALLGLTRLMARTRSLY